jgi:hypothetical protein
MLSIYTLSDPRNPSVIRYVGSTYDPHKRLISHVSTVTTGKSKNKNLEAWILELVVDDLTPVLQVIETHESGHRGSLEGSAISRAAVAGYPLLNTRIPRHGRNPERFDEHNNYILKKTNGKAAQKRALLASLNP